MTRSWFRSFYFPSEVIQEGMRMTLNWRENLKNEESILVCNTKRRTPEFKKAKRLLGISSAIVFIFSVSSSWLCCEPFFRHQQQPISGAKPLQRIAYNPRDDSPDEGRDKRRRRALCGGTELNLPRTQSNAAPPRNISTSQLSAAGWTSGWDCWWAWRQKPEAAESGRHALCSALSHFATWILTLTHAQLKGQ